MASLFLLGLSKSNTKKGKDLDQKKSKPTKNRPSEKFINEDNDKQAMQISGESKKQKANKNKKKKQQKHSSKRKQEKSHVKKVMVGRPKELIPEDIKIVKKAEKITADDLPGAYGEDPTIGMIERKQLFRIRHGSNKELKKSVDVLEMRSVPTNVIPCSYFNSEKKS